MNSTPSERVAILGAVNFSAVAGSGNSGRIALDGFSRLMAIVNLGTVAAGATVSAKLQGSVGVAGDLVDIPGAAITPLAAAGSSNKRAIIDLNTGSLARLGYTHVQLTVTAAGGDADRGALVLGFDPRHAPASKYGHASVAEIITV